ncbi:SDR family oxidoreductase [Roseomonas sp. OT10]|uniref:SDR family NAD(P)-dependent oxidoreductase n=1 Tax=Roseomonas cutis TaxID=2897332 RepID=UPI001E489565|nr:SDR family oxidoreductase [Roseomonas sp. OT10]UFN48001.1 SDR family oxidoreductase [Roseomonas sp. OT10]
MSTPVARGPVAGRLAGRTALVTGAGQGIGRGIARLFTAAGAAVLACDRTAEGLDALAAEVAAAGGVLRPVVADVADPAAPARLVAAAEALGPLDILVNNAAAYGATSLLDTTDEDWAFAQENCLGQVFRMCRAAVGAMVPRGRGSIVNLASVNQIHGNPRLPAYTAAKGGVCALTLQIAIEYGPRGLRCNALSPGLVLTERTREGLSESDLRTTLEAYPVGRAGEPEDVAYAALFLASDEAGFVNGVDLPVDGGLTVLAASAIVSPKIRRWYGREPWPAG